MLVSQLLLAKKECSHPVTEIAAIALLYHLFFHSSPWLLRFWTVIFAEAVSVSASWVEQVMERKRRRKMLSKVRTFKPSARWRLHNFPKFIQPKPLYIWLHILFFGWFELKCAVYYYFYIWRHYNWLTSTVCWVFKLSKVVVILMPVFFFKWVFADILAYIYPLYICI